MFKGVTISGKKLARLREDKLLTQEELAQKLGLSKGNISRIEGEDRTGMQVRNFRKLAEVLAIPTDHLRRLIGSEGGDSVVVELAPEDSQRLQAYAEKHRQSVEDAAAALVLKGLGPRRKPDLDIYVERKG